MGNHVIADEGLGVVDWYSDVPRIFLEKGMISLELSEKCWVRMIGFRNTLVHGYMDVDRTIIYEVLQNGLGDIEELKRVFHVICRFPAINTRTASPCSAGILDQASY